MVTEHKVIVDAELHEPKGVASATNGQIYIANGSGGGTWTTPVFSKDEIGWYNYQDVLTVTTPINLATADTDFELTNDGAGVLTNKTFGLTGIPDLWDVVTNRFDFSSLSVGDMVDIRFDIEVVTTVANTATQFSMELGLGAAPFTLDLRPLTDHKLAATYQDVIYTSIFMGDVNVVDNPARLLAQADKTGATVKVNGWYVRGIRLG